MAEDGAVRYHHQLKGQEFEQALGDNGGRRAWHASPWGHRVRLNLATDQQQQ